MKLPYKILRYLAKRRRVYWVLASYSPWRSHYKCWRATSLKEARKDASRWVGIHPFGEANVFNSRPTYEDRGKLDYFRKGSKWVAISSDLF